MPGVCFLEFLREGVDVRETRGQVKSTKDIYMRLSGYFWSKIQKSGIGMPFVALNCVLCSKLLLLTSLSSHMVL